MDINSATPLPEPDPSLVGSVSGASGLSTLQRAWAREFILSAGNATKAAVLAGYAETSAHISGRKNCLNPAVMAYVKQLSVADAQQFLPIAIRTFVDVACDPDQDGRARVMAAEKLVLMAGAMPRNAAVQVNVDNRTINVTAQAIIEEIWKAREARSSSIAGGMSDTSTAQAQPAIEPPRTSFDGVPGGGELSGSHPGTSPIPPHSSARRPEIVEARAIDRGAADTTVARAGPAASAWRAATAAAASRAVPDG